MSFREIVKSMGRSVNHCFPKQKDKILFESNSDFCDNTRALYDYLIQNGYDKRYRFVWCVKDPSAFHSDNMKRTKLVSFQKPSCFLSYFKELATSKYVFYTHNPPPLCNPKAQTVINLWHGTPLKILKGHAHPAKLFTKILSPGRYFDPIMEDSFGASSDQMLHCGYPRCDLLFENADALKALGIKKEAFQKVALWMPTFRRPAGGQYQDAPITATGLPLTDIPQKLEELNRHLAAANVLLIIKLHPGQDMSGVKLLTLDHLKMLTNRELDEKNVQLYHLVGEADALVTDYSSIYFDYLLLNRPIAFVIDDIESYQKNRGFTVDDPLSLMPGAKIKTLPDFYRFFDDLSKEKDDFSIERKQVNDLVNECQDGNSSRRFAEQILEQC